MVNNDGTIQARAIIADQIYEVSETKYGLTHSVWDARDVIINRTTGKKIEKTRKQWKKFFDDFHEKQKQQNP